MAIETCERCGGQTAKLARCDYCHKKICSRCVKSEKRRKIDHRRICKTCWSSMAKRSAFKSAN